MLGLLWPKFQLADMHEYFPNIVVTEYLIITGFFSQFTVWKIHEIKLNCSFLTVN